MRDHGGLLEESRRAEHALSPVGGHQREEGDLRVGWGSWGEDRGGLAAGAGLEVPCGATDRPGKSPRMKQGTHELEMDGGQWTTLTAPQIGSFQEGRRCDWW